MIDQRHSYQSTQRELLIEHIFVGELMKRMWLRRLPDLEVSKPQADNAGYDLILEAGGIIRHLQLKSSQRGTKGAGAIVQLALGSKPSGCVIWVYFDPRNLELGPFFWFGGPAGSQLPSLSKYRVAKQTRGNASGVKAERPNLRVIPKSRFTSLTTVDEVVDRLFGIRKKSGEPQSE